MSENQHHNLQIMVTPDHKFARLLYHGPGQFMDAILDKTQLADIAEDLCRTAKDMRHPHLRELHKTGDDADPRIHVSFSKRNATFKMDIGGHSFNFTREGFCDAIKVMRESTVRQRK